MYSPNFNREWESFFNHRSICYQTSDKTWWWYIQLSRFLTSFFKNIMHYIVCSLSLLKVDSFAYSWEKNFKEKKIKFFSGNPKKTWLETSSSGQVKFCFNRFKSGQVQVQPDLELQVKSSLNIFKFFGHSNYLLRRWGLSR